LADFGRDTLDIVANFPNALIGMTPQGMMRQWQPPFPCQIQYTPFNPEPALLARIDILVMSIEDVHGDQSCRRALCATLWDRRTHPRRQWRRHLHQRMYHTISTPTWPSSVTQPAPVMFLRRLDGTLCRNAQCH
jgi:hypothetical protein